MYKLILKLRSKRWGRRLSRGYLLPVTILLGLGISLISSYLLQIDSLSSSTLNTQYYNQLAYEAAQAGVSAAVGCVNAGQTDWDTNGNPKLGPNTDCHGATLSGVPTTIVSQDNMQSTYSVKALDTPYADTRRTVTSTGTVTLKTKGGAAAQTFKKIVKTLGTLNTVTSGGFSNNLYGISAGDGDSCGISGGAAYCWGYGGNGQLGTGNSNNTKTPAAVLMPAGLTVASISVGEDVACALTTSGAAYCWGNNANGELGNGSAVGYSATPVLVSTPAGKTVTSISAGYNQVCEIAGGAAYCWGNNADGQLGTGNTTNHNTPTAVYASSGGALYGLTVTAISAGKNYVTAIAGGNAYQWGDNDWGYQGVCSPHICFVTGGQNSNYPTAIPQGSIPTGATVTSIASDAFPTGIPSQAYSNHTCLVANGTVYCWGATNGWFAFGNSASNTPTALGSYYAFYGQTATAVTAGGDFMCVIANSQPYCYGMNGSGQTTGGGQVNIGSTPTTAVSGGASYTCAVANAKAYCWGYNGDGELGNGSTVNASTPQPVASTGGTPTTTYSFDNQMRF